MDIEKLNRGDERKKGKKKDEAEILGQYGLSATARVTAAEDE
jgi:hypothetical protein